MYSKQPDRKSNFSLSDPITYIWNLADLHHPIWIYLIFRFFFDESPAGKYQYVNLCYLYPKIDSEFIMECKTRKTNTFEHYIYPWYENLSEILTSDSAATGWSSGQWIIQVSLTWALCELDTFNLKKQSLGSHNICFRINKGSRTEKKVRHALFFFRGYNHIQWWQVIGCWVHLNIKKFLNI